ncbi:paired box protein Pax-6 [Caerostris extrusa]|uniref:Paired box protein Pax-6 n=1 Tax=Caerostris extrusa TaxID=172846 RepID=A0AAV4Q9V5_CAEEX|nr:paired box protein Pax-6 [Caerostris extrusa]
MLNGGQPWPWYHTGASHLTAAGVPHGTPPGRALCRSSRCRRGDGGLVGPVTSAGLGVCNGQHNGSDSSPKKTSENTMNCMHSHLGLNLFHLHPYPIGEGCPLKACNSAIPEPIPTLSSNYNLYLLQLLANNR